MELAEKELQYAEKDLRDPTADFFAPTCFHFQQAAEKSLKAYLLAKKKAFRRIHNLVELLELCAAIDPTLLDLRGESGSLNPFYTDSRYPVHWPINITREDAEKAKEASLKIIQTIQQKLH